MWPYIYNIPTLCHAAMFHSESVSCVRTSEWAVLRLILHLDQLR